MSRWADRLAALSRASDTLDTMRHFSDAASTVSQSVNSVTDKRYGMHYAGS